ncbi:MAG: hypothetical protein CMI19_03230 [Opitutae bacterium]|nr:hypothetical protein [Opitutae bacterium]|tara:strand:+ start:16038 stop:16334 length:297 start_codon:yes stop_codon:yes gene_type:complete
MNDLENFAKHIAEEENPEEDWSDLVKSLWWAKKGNWEKAHNIAQDIATNDGSWIHAYLHRVEGDLGNAAYWYRRAGKFVKTNEDLDQEWEEISQALFE